MTERIQLTVQKGALVPADSLSESRLRERGYRIGDVVFAEIKKPRNPGHFRKAHLLGALLVENLDAFEELDQHAALKRVQWESGIGCEEIGVQTPEGWKHVRWPLSLSYESMDQSAFERVYSGLCRHIAKTYWPDMTAEQIEQMAEMMG